MANGSNIPFNPQNRPPQKNAKADEWFEKMLENQRKARTIGVPQLRQPNEMNPVPLGRNPDAGTSAGQTAPVPKTSPAPENTSKKPPAPGKARTEPAFAQSAKNLRDMQYIRELLPIAAQSAQGKPMDSGLSARLYQGMAQLGLNTGAPAYETLLRRRKEIEQSLAARQSTAKDAAPAQTEHAASPVTFAQVLKSLEDTALIRDLLPHAAQKTGGLVQDSGVLSKLKEGLSYLGIDDNDSAYDALNRRNAEAKQNRAAYQAQASNTGAAQAPSPANMARIFEGLQDIQFMRSLLPIAARQAQGGNISREQAARLSYGLSQLGLKVQGTAYDALIRRIKETDQEMDGYENPAVLGQTVNMSSAGEGHALDHRYLFGSSAGLPSSVGRPGFPESDAGDYLVVDEPEEQDKPVNTLPPLQGYPTDSQNENTTNHAQHGSNQKVNPDWFENASFPNVLHPSDGDKEEFIKLDDGIVNSWETERPEGVSKVPLDFFIAAMAQMYREGWMYKSGGAKLIKGIWHADCNSARHHIKTVYGVTEQDDGSYSYVSKSVQTAMDAGSEPFLLQRGASQIMDEEEDGEKSEQARAAQALYDELSEAIKADGKVGDKANVALRKKLYKYMKLYCVGQSISDEDIARLAPGDILISVTKNEKGEYLLHMLNYVGPCRYYDEKKKRYEYTPHGVFHMPGEGKKAKIVPIEDTWTVLAMRDPLIDYSDYMDYVDSTDAQIIREYQKTLGESQP